jgi:hypothetical protein
MKNSRNDNEITELEELVQRGSISTEVSNEEIITVSNSNH